MANFSTVVLGRFSWDVNSRELYRLDKNDEHYAKKCVLTPKQHQLLTCLIDAYPSTLKKEQIIEKVWGSKHISQESLPQLINRTRQSLEDGNKSILVNEPGIGYSLNFTPVVSDRTTKTAPCMPDNDDTSTSTQPMMESQLSNAPSVSIRHPLWCALLGCLFFGLILNLWKLTTAIYYQQDFLDVLNAKPYPEMTKGQDGIIHLTIDNHECTYYKTQLLLQCP
ncbi:hypothetical protein ABT58_04345 [Photobacterium aphoticum]|uniref:OmpR/PhoB-type domain-containing protein n=1 Tax=Photobacterium aphoticum TaxID=754436 RepID=A0A0J1GQW4_9GAMM|nr:hypothetical protein ABT58_04345 [Photobacterium aphoticum]